MEYLVANMPEPDLRSLTAEYLIDNVSLAYQSWGRAPWRESVPHEVFLEAVLPYAVIDERRDYWRRELQSLCLPLVSGVGNSGQAATTLNREIFPRLGVQYNVERSKNNQSAREVMAEQKATCTGLSILLIQACRSVGVPARFAGTPLWPDSSGNHSWVEVWENGWRYTGAAEPADGRLDEAWFSGRAASSIRDEPAHAIYAITYAPTGILFPHGWTGAVDELHAINVTERYTTLSKETMTPFLPPPGMSRVEFVALDQPGGKRVAVAVEVRDASGEIRFTGVTKPSTADLRDHLFTFLPQDREYRVSASFPAGAASTSLRTRASPETCTLYSRDEEPPCATHGWGRSPRDPDEVNPHARR
jgi:hypothetical protein